MFLFIYKNEGIDLNKAKNKRNFIIIKIKLEKK